MFKSSYQNVTDSDHVFCLFTPDLKRTMKKSEVTTKAKHSTES